MGYFQKEWLIFFYDPPNEEWYHIFRKKGMAHCGAFYFDPYKSCWIMIEHIHKRLDVSLLQGDELNNVIHHIINNNGIILKTKRFRHKWRLFQAAWLREHSCVTVIMRLIGINRLIITPFQLYKYLVKNGSTKWAFLEHQNINQIQKLKNEEESKKKKKKE
jgi:hypothetical protein